MRNYLIFAALNGYEYLNIAKPKQQNYKMFYKGW